MGANEEKYIIGEVLRFKGHEWEIVVRPLLQVELT